MVVEQSVEIPPNRQLLVKVPQEIPIGRAIIKFSSVPETSINNPEDLKTKLQNLRGCLGESAFGGLDGIEYQKKVREEWDR